MSDRGEQQVYLCIWHVFDPELTVAAPNYQIIFFMPSSSVEIWYTLSDHIPTASAISDSFSLWYAKTMFYTFAIISGIVAHLDWPLHGSSSKLFQPDLNLIMHLATVECEGEKSPSVFLKSA